MRLRRPGTDAAAVQAATLFADWLKDVGTGSRNESQGYVVLPAAITVMTAGQLDNQFGRNVAPPADEDLLVEHTYGDLSRDRVLPPQEMLDYFSGRAILTSKNTDVNALNAEMLQLLPGNSVTYFSADSIPGQAHDLQNGEQISVELLNTFNFPGMALHETVIKVGAPIILIRNIDPTRGLTNGNPSHCDPCRCARPRGKGHHWRSSERRCTDSSLSTRP